MKTRFIIPMTFAFQLSNLFAGSMGPVQQPYDFTGFYLGMGTGLTTTFVDDSFSVTRSNGVGSLADTKHYSYSGILFTGNLGYGAMISQKTYLGAKASIYYTPIQQTDETGFSTSTPLNHLITGNNTLTFSMKPIYNIDAVLGYEIFPHFLPFVEAGVSFGDVKRGYVFKMTKSSLPDATTANYDYSLSLDKYKTSYNAGIGINYQPRQHWILSTELVYIDLGKNSGSSTTNIPGGTVTETHTRSISNSDVALFGSISYLF